MCSLAACSLLARGKDTEAKLVASIARERKPIKRAKLEVRLGTVQLRQAIRAYDRSQIPEGQKLLLSFLGDMENSWKILQSTGRNAAKKPDGFQQLEIALHEDARRLDDLRRRVFYLDRGPVEQALSTVERLHGKVLLALFPGAVRNAGLRIQAGQPKVQGL